MKKNIKKTLITLATTLSAILIVTTATYAIGTLTPSGTAGDNTQYTLNDIYTRLTTNQTATVGSGAFTVPTGTATSTFYTLSEIYDAIPTIDATKVATGTAYLGVDGTAELATTLQWSTAQPDANWADAGTACAALTEGGATVGDWRLPTISELLAGISDDWIIDGSGSRFASYAYYWSGTEYDGSIAWSAYWYDYVSYYDGDKTNSLSVLCVR